MTQWLTTTNHKQIGILYISTTFFFFILAGVLALLIRAAALSAPDQNIVTPHEYNQIFTLHGTAMIFLVIAPFAFGLANYLVPLQIGAHDMAFPRLNALGVWLFIFGGITVFIGRLCSRRRRPSAGWTAYAPLSTIIVGTGGGQDLWLSAFCSTASRRSWWPSISWSRYCCTAPPE